MPRRVKDEERIEMIIRGLLKQPENRRCINCNSLGPQYVCTTFWTFVCTNCSGVHREFTHRVKSVSMAKFNDEEIMALQAGGNERAREIYFKTWDPERNHYPDSSNLQRLREFVSHVYVDRKYSGQNSSKKPMVNMGSRSNSCQWPSIEKSNRGRRDEFLDRPFERASSSGREEFYDCSSFDKLSPCTKSQGLNLRDFLEERSPRNIQENGRSSSLRNRPHLEIVDDRFREDGSVKRYERNSRVESRSPHSPSTAKSLPAIRPLNAILGEKVPALRIAGPPKGNDMKDTESSIRGQKAADATIPGPTGGDEKQYKSTNLSSLIDFFDAESESEPASNIEEPEAQKVASDTNNKSSSVASSTTQVAANALEMNSVESLLFDWPAPVTSPSSGTSQMSTQLNSPKAADFGTTKPPEISNNCKNPTVQEIQMHQLPSKQQNQTFVSPPGNTSSSSQQSATLESLSNQHQWNKSPASNDPQAANPGEGSTHGTRKEIPQDLFASNFTSFAPVAGMQLHPPHGGYDMQFRPPVMMASAFPNPSKPKNPFDIGDDRSQVQAGIFPSMSSLQGALPNMPTSTALESQPSPYAAAMSSHVSPYRMNMPLVPGAYMGQLSNNMPLTRPQLGNSDFGRNEDTFASLNPIQRASGTDSLPAAPTSPSSQVRNPFG